jgi:peroxiredoxin
MKQKTLFILLFSACAIATSMAQLTDGSVLIETLNERLAAVKKGQFTVDAKFKFADGDDTIAHKGVCYFFRESNPDAFAQFIIFMDERPVYAFDGTTFFQLAGRDKYWVTDVAEAGGVRQMLRGNIMKRNLVYQPIFQVGKPNFTLSYFDTVALSAVHQEDGLKVLRLTLRDTSVEEALGDVENNKIIATRHFDIALPDFYLVQRTSIVWLFDGWEYEKKVFSPITPLPAEAKFSDYFNPEALAQTYVFEQYDPSVRPKRDVELIKKGDKLPNVALPDLTGKTVSLDDQKKGLILLDFWYKGCFPCQLAMPKIERLHQKYAAKGLNVFGVNPFDKNNDQLKEWLLMRKVSYNTLFDPEKKLPTAVGILGYPLLIIADAKTKKVLHMQTGFSEEMGAELERVIMEKLR